MIGKTKAASASKPKQGINLPLPPSPGKLHHSMMLCAVDYPFEQLGSAVLALSPLTSCAPLAYSLVGWCEKQNALMLCEPCSALTETSLVMNTASSTNPKHSPSHEENYPSQNQHTASQLPSVPCLFLEFSQSKIAILKLNLYLVNLVIFRTHLASVSATNLILLCIPVFCKLRNHRFDILWYFLFFFSPFGLQLALLGF